MFIHKVNAEEKLDQRSQQNSTHYQIKVCVISLCVVFCSILHCGFRKAKQSQAKQSKAKQSQATPSQAKHTAAQHKSCLLMSEKNILIGVAPGVIRSFLWSNSRFSMWSATPGIPDRFGAKHSPPGHPVRRPFGGSSRVPPVCEPAPPLFLDNFGSSSSNDSFSICVIIVFDALSDGQTPVSRFEAHPR